MKQDYLKTITQCYNLYLRKYNLYNNLYNKKKFLDGILIRSDKRTKSYKTLFSQLLNALGE